MLGQFKILSAAMLMVVPPAVTSMFALELLSSVTCVRSFWSNNPCHSSSTLADDADRWAESTSSVMQNVVRS